MRYLLLVILLATVPDAVGAQTCDLALIAQDESGHRNVPNFRFDRHHSAGGHYQITQTLFEEFKHRVPGADDYPNALAMPEQLQGQMAGWICAEKGYIPWSCCNAQLRRDLSGTASPRAGSSSTGLGVGPSSPAAAPEVNHDWGEPIGVPGPTSPDLFAMDERN